MSFFERCMTNLNEFYEKSPKTHIKFFFFLTSDFDKKKPQAHLREEFKKIQLDKKNYYITKGIHPNYLYIYEESELKYTIKTLGKSTLLENVYEAEITGISKERNTGAHVGNHLDIGVIQQRDATKVLLKSHYTEYTDEIGNFDFERDVYYCNRTIAEKDKVSNLEDFGNLRCEKKDGTTTREDYTSVFHKNHVKILHKLYKVFLTGHCKYHKERTLSSSSCGGMTLREYKGVTFMSSTFEGFMIKTVFKPIKAIRRDLEMVSVFYDEMNELNKRGNERIVVLYDFVSGVRRKFYLNAENALISCYVEREQNLGNVHVLEEKEQKIHQHFIQMVKMFT